MPHRTRRLLPWWLRCLPTALAGEFPSLRMFYLWSRSAGRGRWAALVHGWDLFVFYAKRK